MPVAGYRAAARRLPGIRSVAAAGLPGGQSGAIAEDRQLGRLYVAQPASNVVFVLAASTMDVQAVLKIPPSPSAIVVDETSHRVYVGRAEIGAAWSKRSEEGRDYLSTKLDDPSFNAPIYANLFDEEDGEGYTLIWSRPRKTSD